MRHTALLEHCIELMSGADGLREDICGCTFPGEFRQEVEEARVDKGISPALRYACLYWVHHLKEGGRRIDDDSTSYTFLKTHFLHWLEALSFIRRATDSIRLVGLLQSLVAVGFGQCSDIEPSYSLLTLALSPSPAKEECKHAQSFVASKYSQFAS